MVAEGGVLMPIKKGVSTEARAAVVKRSHGWCELFHDTPVEGSMIVHTDHQGMGGAAEDAECNDPNKLIWGCKACHDLADGRLKAATHVFEGVNLGAGELEIFDSGRHRLPHEQIFFYQIPTWLQAAEEYPELVDAVRRMNEASFDVAKHLALFKPKRKGPELFRVCPEVKQMSKASFDTFVSLLGMTKSKARDLLPTGNWLRSEDLSSVRGFDIDAIDALRQAPEEEFMRLIGLFPEPVKFWAAVDAATAKKHGRRSHYMRYSEDTGKLEDLGLHAVTPEVAEAFSLIKGSFVTPGEKEPNA